MLKVADMEVKGLKEQFLDYVKKQETEYSETKNIVDRVLTLIPTLSDIGQIVEGQHYKFQTQNKGEHLGETWVCFKKNVVISVLNKYYAHDKSKHFDDDQFTRYARHHNLYRSEKTVDYSGKKAYSICFCVDGLKEYGDTGNVNAEGGGDDNSPPPTYNNCPF